MEKIRIELTNENLSFLNKKRLSITKAINNFIEYFRINDELGEEDIELRNTLSKVISKSIK